MSSRPIILGLGNDMCGDDAAGQIAVKDLAIRLGETVRVAHDAWPLLECTARDARGGLMVIIDAAAATGEFPVGQCRKIRYPREAALLSETRLWDTHTLGLEALLKLGRTLGTRWPRIWIYAVAGCRFGLGETPSPEVLRALPALIQRIEAEVRAWQSRRPLREPVESDRALHA